MIFTFFLDNSLCILSSFCILTKEDVSPLLPPWTRGTSKCSLELSSDFIPSFICLPTFIIP